VGLSFLVACWIFRMGRLGLLQILDKELQGYVLSEFSLI